MEFSNVKADYNAALFEMWRNGVGDLFIISFNAYKEDVLFSGTDDIAFSNENAVKKALYCMHIDIENITDCDITIEIRVFEPTNRNDWESIEDIFDSADWQIITPIYTKKFAV